MTTPKTRPTIVLGESHSYPVLPLRDIVVFPHMIVPLFVGREKSIRALEEVMKNDALILLATQKNALVKQYGRLFEMEGVKLSFTEDALRSVATRAIARRTGARGLRSIMEAILLATMFDLPGLDGVEEVVINREVAESRANPLYLYGKERAESSA